ncbi:hypothetical protein HLB23_03560 [Nocardia uniformis]|uniref:DUF7144 domain-containing protein n=1 Tax=Nocardia uniformis TaxID=53432 RepID=A0A849BV56_9NOCA|nr:hypothetical protein [Nocardia uniformis]NNH68958.1 hypothetical protein [Nocardia uniformis]
MSTPVESQPIRQPFAAGTSFGAAILLLTLGVLSILQGISAVINDELFVVGVAYVYEFDITAWGWVHIVLGAILVICSLGLMTGTAWGRGAAIGIAALSIIANFLWLPYYPWWSVLVIALDIIVIWAIATWRPQF